MFLRVCLPVCQVLHPLSSLLVLLPMRPAFHLRTILPALCLACLLVPAPQVLSPAICPLLRHLASVVLLRMPLPMFLRVCLPVCQVLHPLSSLLVLLPMRPAFHLRTILPALCLDH